MPGEGNGMEESYPYTVAENEHGLICVPVSSAHTYTSRAILAGRVHEPETIRFIIDNHGGKDVVHAGAGFGDFLPGLSKGCGGTIWTFEPNRENHFCARRTIELNGLQNVVLSDCGLGDAPAVGRLQVHEEGASLGPRSQICEGAVGPDVQECTLVKLDDVLAGKDISIIHLDTEGHEFRILDGSRELIDRCHPLIILEIDDRALKYNDYMDKLGYRPIKQLIYDAHDMVFVNTVYGYSGPGG
jgi:FkbM family methyltransferase